MVVRIRQKELEGALRAIAGTFATSMCASRCRDLIFFIFTFLVHVKL